jgi:ABC-type phosphate/phosphonate transport system substrate-binding protein/outer membrane protein assembly factor BamB
MRWMIALTMCLALCVPRPASAAAPAAKDDKTLSMVVMDPLAEPLSCPCVQGYAQRKYEKLAEYLSKALDRPVQVTFAESFEKALAKETCKTIDIAIGKDSVVRADATTAKMKVTPVARLTGKDGLTTMTGMIVVRTADPAQRLEDLKGYRVLFGTKECDEKFAAPRIALSGAGVELPSVEKAETTQSCSDGACKIIEWGDTQRAAAVISSYAAPLLEGCGTIKKGDLRVISETQPVPFITAFTSDRVDRASREKVEKALLEMGKHAELREALETLTGFVELGDDYQLLRESVSISPPVESREPAGAADAPGKSESPPAKTGAGIWPQWRGPNRDGHVQQLPATLPEKAAVVWRRELQRPGLGGIAATDRFVVLGDRDLTNNFDEFRCHDAVTGDVLWTVQYPAMGQLDYDNTPRATPLIHENRAYLFGAFGDLTCVELDTGLSLWQKNVIKEFGGEKELVWGTCSSPLIVDGKLIVNPGGENASVVALDPKTGDAIWQSPGGRHAYASFIVATLGGVRQLVGYDQATLGGWDIATGSRLWTLKPPHDGDFNVPTPVAVDGKLLVTTESNYTRLYEFGSKGQIIAEPIALYKELAPDMSTPVVVGTRLFCVCGHLYCLDITNGLKPVWIGDDDAFGDYAPLIASEDRLLTVGLGGELILIDPKADKFTVLSRLTLFEDDQSKQTQFLSHPALVGTRLYLRGERELVCVELAPVN